MLEVRIELLVLMIVFCCFGIVFLVLIFVSDCEMCLLVLMIWMFIRWIMKVISMDRMMVRVMMVCCCGLWVVCVVMGFFCWW